MSHWKTIATSKFPHEREALEFLKSGIPEHAKVSAWSNFEFMADAGSLYEVDALIVSPWGAFLVEIKSRPGAVSGLGNMWSWHQDGKSFSSDNPLLLANSKAKALKALLGRTTAFKQERCPFIEPLIFLSHASNALLLKGNDAFYVTNRDSVIDAIYRRQCPGLRTFQTPPISQNQLRALDKAMDQIGIQALASTRRAGDYTLDSLFWDCPTGTYQDWIGHHSTVKSGDRLIRIYLQHNFTNKEDAEALQNAANRECRILSHLDHPGILRAETLTQSNNGPAVVFRFHKEAKRLDHYLEEHRDQLTLDQRIDLLRKTTEAIAYAHGNGVIHRSLSPQSILVIPPEGSSAYPTIKIHNWQVGLQQTTQNYRSSITRMSRTLHVGQWVEDASTVYLAPEIASGHSLDGTELDVFSLGAIAYTLFSGQRPADNVLELNAKLRDSDGYLDLRSVVNSPDEKMVDLIRFSACADRGKRYTADDFLDAIEKLEDSLTDPGQPECIDPRQARIGDLLENGLRVSKILGTGSISRVLLVEDAEQLTRVLKAASSPEHNDRIHREFQTLQSLSFQGIVKAYDCFDFGDIRGFTMDLAGEHTLAKRLRDDGKFEIDFLERFGKQLLQIVDYLDQQGTPHRDIKPHNIGIGLSGKGALRLVLFDFSLSQSPLDQIQVGTPPYLDPFLENRRHRRWDSHAERFAAAMTLYEMATGSPATFGDGASAPHLTQASPNIESDLFPEGVREAMASFFRKALHPDSQKRHDNAEEMLRAWVDLFANASAPVLTAHPSIHETNATGFSDEVIADAQLDTQLILLGLSTRLANAFDRIGLTTVKDLLAYPLGSIQRMRGVGHKTRTEAKTLFRKLRKRFANWPEAVTPRLAAIEDDLPNTPELASVDLIVKKVLAIDSRRQDSIDYKTLCGYLGMGSAPSDNDRPAWPSQSDYAGTTTVTRARIGQIITGARERWSRVPALTFLRDTLAEVLPTQGGVMTLRELIQTVLHLRGSLLEDPERQRMASVAARAAVETERGLKKPRFYDYRRGNRIFIAMDSSLADYARDLGDEADKIAGQDPLPTPARVIDCLQRIAFPEVGAIPPPGASRIASLAVAASQSAALSAKLEIYPRQLSADRALRLAQNNLFGSSKLTVDEIRHRVASRYPDAEPLPGRPTLDGLLAGINLPLRWSDSSEAYTLPPAGDAHLSTGITRISRTHTRFEPTRTPPSEAEVEAQRVQDKLEYGIRQGSWLVLAAEAQHLDRAEAELLKRFPLHPIDGDRLFLSAMRQVADALGVNWNVVLEADAADPHSRDWETLLSLVRRAIPTVRSTIEQAPGPVLLTHPGLFIRYQQLPLLDVLRNQVGTHQGPPSLWLLIPGGDHQASLGGAAIPILNPAHFEKLNEAWLANKPIRHAKPQ
jgi:serine/threonine protein kinase